ncbi:hypothetical protein FACS1894172_08040 [Spirochaetia bacterium]|nr:hypothetical protein FACS1894172_08040 [Spirochaetia bacterium]
MKKIKLFVASSLTGLERDRLELGAFIGDLNDRYVPYGVYFQLVMDGEQDALTEEAVESELFYIIFHSDTRPQAIAEFDAAYESFKNAKKPRISTYFKKIDAGEPQQSVLDFMSRLSKELGHYYNKYSNVDTIKLNIVLQMKSLGLYDAMEIKDSAVFVGGKELMTLENIPIIFNNKQLAALKDGYATIEKEYWAIRKKIRQNPDDEEALGALLHISGQKNKASEAIHSLQKDIIDMETSFLEKVGSGYISERYKSARDCLEEGDIEGAKQILAVEDLKRDGANALELLESRKKEIKALVNDWLQRVDVLKMDVGNKNRFTEIEEAYEEAIKLEKDGGLERKTLCKFANYLGVQNQYIRAIEYAETYLSYLKSEKDEDAALGGTYQLLAKLYIQTNRLTEAEELYKKALAIWKRLAAENPAAYENSLATSYDNLAFLYSDINRLAEAEELYKKDLAITERLAAGNPAVYESDLAGSYDNLALLYSKTNRLAAEAEELHKKDLAIWERLAGENPAAYESDLAISYNNLAFLYEKTNRLADVEELYKKALIILERLAKKNPVAYESDLVAIYDNFAILYKDNNRLAEAEKLYKKALAIYERLAKERPLVYESRLVIIYNNLAILYEDTNQLAEAEKLHKKIGELINEEPIKKFSMILKYFNTDVEYEFALIKKGGKYYLSDQGKTYRALDNVFELAEEDVQKNLNAIIKECNVLHKKQKTSDGQNEEDVLLIELAGWNDERNIDTDIELKKSIYDMFSCVSFMDKMHIFYV